MNIQINTCLIRHVGFRMICVLGFIVFLVGISVCNAQQVPVYSQYMFNKFIINPAVAGSEGYTAYTLTSRIQWMGFRDAPITNDISYQTRLVKNRSVISLTRKRARSVAPEYGNMGLGFQLYNDRRGLLNQTGLQLTYAYHIKVYVKEQLSFGITSSLTQFKVNSDRVRTFQPDGYLNSNKLSAFIPDFNAGVFFTNKYTYLGFAVSQIFQKARYLGNSDQDHFKLDRNYNIMGGYRAELSSMFALEPSFYFKTTENLLFQLDTGCRMYYRNQLWGGLAFRTGNVLIITFGAKYKHWYFGLAYDYSFNEMQTYSYGSSELIIAFKIAKFPWKYKWVERL